MTSIRILAPSLAALAFVSCASQKTDPYAAASAGPATEPANPIYDTPAAYEESSATTPAPEVTTPTAVAQSASPVATAPRAPSNGAAIIHTVVAGDTLSRISSKYKVPVAAIKQANRMTNDIVVLGKKMVIPPVH
jgi:LysM repeat protein